MLLVWLGMWRGGDGGALGEPVPASGPGELQHGQPGCVAPGLEPVLVQLQPTGHVLPAAVQS